MFRRIFFVLYVQEQVGRKVCATNVKQTVVIH